MLRSSSGKWHQKTFWFPSGFMLMKWSTRSQAFICTSASADTFTPSRRAFRGLGVELGLGLGLGLGVGVGLGLG